MECQPTRISLQHARMATFVLSAPNMAKNSLAHLERKAKSQASLIQTSALFVRTTLPALKVAAVILFTPSRQCCADLATIVLVRPLMINNTPALVATTAPRTPFQAPASASNAQPDTIALPDPTRCISAQAALTVQLPPKTTRTLPAQMAHTA
jgi:hypothetical protein